MKILTVLTLMTIAFIAIPSIKTYAAYNPVFVGGILDDPNNFTYSSNISGAVGRAWDNDDDVGNYVAFQNKTLTIEFNKPWVLTKYNYNLYGNGRTITIRFYDDLGNLIFTRYNYETYRGYKNFPFDDKTPIKKVTIQSPTDTALSIYEMEFFGSETNPYIEHFEIEGINVDVDRYSAEISWENPSHNAYFKEATLYRNGEKIQSFTKESGVTTYKDTGLEEETNYEYKVTATYIDDEETEGLKKTVKTLGPPKPAGDVISLKATAEQERVNLSWVLPKDKQFKHVNIYRETVTKETTSAFKEFFVGTKVYADDYKKIFETNGTYFNDLTVSPNTEYEYKLTTMSTDGLESEGVYAKAKTLPVSIVGGKLEEDENGNYNYKWSEPTKGQVKVIIAGKDYKTVPAEQKQIVIPKSDMKYNSMGDPDIRIVPISESGEEGAIVKPPSQSFAEIELPFGVKDLLKSGSGLLWWIAPFVLLGLSFLLVPKLRNLIIRSFKGKKEKISEVSERRTSKIQEVLGDKEPKTEKETEKIPIEKPKRQLRSVRVRERYIKDRRERTLKEPKISRITREERQPRQSNRMREQREGRQSERLQRIPREPRKGR